MTDVQRLVPTLSDRYVVEREIGRGGMATVYLARDVRHNRHVALKVLNPELGAVLGVERFLSEIRVTANLQHPNLLPLFDSGEADGLLFYVMPYVDGETLRARLEREKQLPVDEALRIAVAIASALEYAHAHGVVHRDLKPENILIQAGQPVIADFGIALAISNAGGNRVTQSGLSLGTPQYMSPEQATGDRNIDGRSDIYSLAAVLYEMLAGDPPHSGTTAQAIIARLLTEKPRSLLTVRNTVPPHVDAAIERALAKLPADRFATAREFAEALQGMRPMLSVSTTAGAPPASSRKRRRMLAAAPWAVAMVAIAALVWQRAQARTASHDRIRFTIGGDSATAPREEAGGANVALSPDGRAVVYVGGPRRRLLWRTLTELETRALPSTEGASMPRFSPDGKWLAFVKDGKALFKMPVAGGPMFAVTDSANRYSWGDGDQIVLAKNGNSANDGLWLVSAAGGALTHLTRVDSAHTETGHVWPEFLPGGRAVLLEISHGNPPRDSLGVVSLDDHVVRRLGLEGTNPRYVNGYIIFGRSDGTLVAAGFDLRSLRATTPAVTVLTDVHVKGGGATEVAVAQNGTLAYVVGQSEGVLELVDTTGAAHPVGLPNLSYSYFRFSPSGDRIAFSSRESRTTNSDIWVYSLASKTLTRLTNDGKSNIPQWTPDGRRISWSRRDSAGASAWWQSWDGSGQAERLPTDRLFRGGTLWLPDGKSFLMIGRVAGASRVMQQVLGEEARPRDVTSGPGTHFRPSLSKDGRWLAYTSTETGRGEIYVESMAGGGRHQISTDGGEDPIWSPDGRTVYYRNAADVIAARVVTSPSFLVTRRDTLFADRFEMRQGSIGTYDIAPDGKHFLMIGGEATQKAVVVLNWIDELRERMALATKK